jgi:UPF0716 protein FxsA
VFLRLLLLLTIVPLVELVILLRIAEWLSWQTTIMLILITGVVGAWLARREGLKALARIQGDLAAGVVPTNAVVDGALILAAGLVLVTPGLLTDLCGFALLIPPFRRWVRRRLGEAFKKRMVIVHHDQPDPFIDVVATSREAEEKSDELQR